MGRPTTKEKDLLLPYIEGVVTKVDVENQRIDVDIPEGLIDDEIDVLTLFLECLKDQWGINYWESSGKAVIRMSLIFAIFQITNTKRSMIIRMAVARGCF